MDTERPGEESPESVRRLRSQVQRLTETVRSLNEQLAQARAATARLGGGAGIEGPGQAGAVARGAPALARQLAYERMVLERDNAIARKLQQALRPVWLADVEGVEFAAEIRSGKRVGGDFYDIIKLSDKCLGVLIADVTGYGLPAAVIMVTARMAFRTFATLASSPKAILEKVNETMLECTLAGHHLTAFLGVLDSEMLTFQYVNASHYPPFLIRGDELTPLDTEGLFVGVFEDPQYEQKSIQLQRGDKLFMFTDGLLKGFPGGVKERALARLRDYLRRHTPASVREVVRGLKDEIVHEPQDDIVILGAQLMRRRARRKTITIASVPTELRRVEDMILPALAAKGYGERYLFAVKLALEESVINAIKHGNQLDSTKKVTIEFSVDDEKTVLSVTDEGEGFDPSAVPDPTKDENLEAFSGRGLVLMRAYMDKVEFNEKGNSVTMTKYAPWHRTTAAG